MKKKLLCAIIAATMMFGSTMAVFAADLSGNEWEDETVSGNAAAVGEATDIKMDAKVKTCQVEVKITRGNRVIANPYGLGVVTVSGGDPVTDSLIGTTIKFENKSNTSIAVGLKGTVTPSADSGISVATSEPKSNPTAKTVYIEAEISSDGTSAHKLQSTKSTGGDEKNLVYTKSGAKQTNIPVLGVEGEVDASKGESTEFTLTLMGSTYQAPGAEWKATDTFEVITTYDIQFGAGKELSKFKN